MYECVCVCVQKQRLSSGRFLRDMRYGKQSHVGSRLHAYVSTFRAVAVRVFK